MDIKNLKFRASSVGHLCSLPRDKSAKEAGELSETAKKETIKCFNWWKYGRGEYITSKYLTSGIEREDNSITDLSLFTKRLLVKSNNRYENDFIIGHPDIEYLEESLKIIEDVKSSYEIGTFSESVSEKIKSIYEWQGRSYLWLSDSDVFRLRYVLTNATPKVIDDAKKKLIWEMSETDPEYIQRAIQIEKNMIFNMAQFKSDYPYYDLMVEDWEYDIPLEERIFTIEFERDLDKEKYLQEMIERAREWADKNLMNRKMFVRL
jgi:hypothetical protein